MNEKEEYEAIVKYRKKLCGEIVELEETPDVKKYKELISRNQRLKKHENELYIHLKNKEYEDCNHVLVYTKEDDKIREGRIYKYCGCIKCGLDESILKKQGKDKNLEEHVQYMYLVLNNSKIEGKQTGLDCGINLAKSMYDEIITDNGEIDDDALIELFKEKYYDLKMKYKSTNESDDPKIKQK